MHPSQPLPHLAVLTVLTAGGPYRCGDILSLAFVEPTVGRILPHVGYDAPASPLEDVVVPESISARVERAAQPYAIGSVLTLSFVDPTVARIHAQPQFGTIKPIVTEHAPSIAQRAVSSFAIEDAKQMRDAAQAQLREAVARHEHSATFVEPHVVERIASDAGKPSSFKSLVHDTRTDVHHEIDTHSIATRPPEPTADTFQDSDPVGNGETLGGAARYLAETQSPLEFRAADPANFTSAHDGREPSFFLTRATGDAQRANDSAQRPPERLGRAVRVGDSFTSIDTSAHATARHPSRNEPEFVDGMPASLAPTKREQELHARNAFSQNAAPAPCVEVGLEWTPERIRRFITVVDKLFTVERLGWYRHVLAMRLLVPDRIACGDAPGDIEAMRHLHALRAASVETLGRPLLAAFMPTFVVTPDWLETIDSPAAARALAGVREAIAPFATSSSATPASGACSTWTIGRVDREDIDESPAASVEAFMPVLIASTSTYAELTEHLDTYRRALIEVFGQTARASEAVRLGAMTQPNHLLDDRLWRLVGTIGETFGDVAVA